MKVVILAGGLGTRLEEETVVKPKPMVEIGGRPILWHIMKIYSSYGYNEFIVCLGYKGHLIKEYFANYFMYTSDVTFDLSKNSLQVHRSQSENWKVTLIDTGDNTQTGGRLRRVQPYLKDEKAFHLTYGDGVSSVDIKSLVEFHHKQNRQATVTAVRPPGRFGALIINQNKVERFEEKPAGDGGYINGGFFVLSPKVFDLIKDDSTVWEYAPMESLARSGQLSAFQHDGFWQPMDTLRDRRHLENLWSNGAPWKVWQD
ncbi:MAG: glucose-1-phosphate cytidylyltransferase [Proteobacteria bacterium]|jgi:glucose-1-phosphate cytidylyltransferase|nr:glucose-1-phosphate cytidylyltransferase [Pseudomonadota bacterium]